MCLISYCLKIVFKSFLISICHLRFYFSLKIFKKGEKNIVFSVFREKKVLCYTHCKGSICTTLLVYYDHGNTLNAYPIAFSELVTYLYESKLNNENTVTHKLADLEKLYRARLLELGIVETTINVTRLKESIHHLREMKAFKKG